MADANYPADLLFHPDHDWARIDPQQPDTAPIDPDPVTPPGHEPTVTPTRVCPRCGASRMILVAEFPPMPLTEGITAGLEPCLILDSS